MNSPEKIPFNDLSRAPKEIRDEINAAIAKVIASGWYVMGPEHAAFEQELADFVDAREAVLLGNGTDALELALAAVGVANGDGVVTVANAGGYTTVAARLLGARLEYSDVDPISLQMTAATFGETLKRLGTKPKAVVVTHLFGTMAPVEQIAGIARGQGIAVVEDCAQALGARDGGKAAGTFGDIATTSFYPTKNLGALGDGGAVFTNNSELADSVRKMRQYGWGTKYRIVHDHGRNSRMDELQAAILRVKLPHLDSYNERRRHIHERYEQAGSMNLRVVGTASESSISHLAVLASTDRDEVRAKFTEWGIGTDVHYPVPDHLQQFPSRPPERLSLPATEQAAKTIFSVPIFPELTDSEVDRICVVIQHIGGQ
ncbi:MAG TPA: DegT/DnrJ/EryC1/StrS family aminotransferase [Terrimesophilobacter sp.]|nr:DegT/DnrJ/EryC1/StrS family aminotransferase [Terrimesophilobacter sp.]